MNQGKLVFSQLMAVDPPGKEPVNQDTGFFGLI